MGLIGDFSRGAAPGVMEIGKQVADYSSRSALMQEEAAIRAEAEARLHERGRGEQLADYETRKADDIAAEERRVKNEKGLIAARRDPSEAKLNELKLQQAESDVKVPSAVRMEYEALKKNNEIISSSLYKAQAEGTYSPETAAKAEATMASNTKRMSELLSPHQGDQAKKEDSKQSSPPTYRYENGKLVAVGAKTERAQPGNVAKQSQSSPQSSDVLDNETETQQRAYADSEKAKATRMSALMAQYQRDMENVQSIKDENIKRQAIDNLKKAARERGLNI